jgi:hypothetical protein
MALKKSQKSLKKWTSEDWGTKSGKPSTQGPKATGERYLPKKARESLSAKEYAATTKKKEKIQRQENNFLNNQKGLQRKLLSIDPSIQSI